MDKITIISESYPWKIMFQVVTISFLVMFVILCIALIVLHFIHRKMPIVEAEKPTHSQLIFSIVIAIGVTALVYALSLAFMSIFIPPTWHQYHVDIDKSMTIEEFDDFCETHKVVQRRQDQGKWIITTAGKLPTE